MSKPKAKKSGAEKKRGTHAVRHFKQAAENARRAAVEASKAAIQGDTHVRVLERIVAALLGEMRCDPLILAFSVIEDAPRLKIEIREAGESPELGIKHIVLSTEPRTPRQVSNRFDTAPEPEPTHKKVRPFNGRQA